MCCRRRGALYVLEVEIQYYLACSFVRFCAFCPLLLVPLALSQHTALNVQTCRGSTCFISLEFFAGEGTAVHVIGLPQPCRRAYKEPVCLLLTCTVEGSDRRPPRRSQVPPSHRIKLVARD